MPSPVTHQIAAYAECQGTIQIRALERLLPCMGSIVYFQTTWSLKAPVANTTLVRFLFGGYFFHLATLCRALGRPTQNPQAQPCRVPSRGLSPSRVRSFVCVIF